MPDLDPSISSFGKAVSLSFIHLRNCALALFLVTCGQYAECVDTLGHFVIFEN
jgi:hypothetical protein